MIRPSRIAISLAIVSSALLLAAPKPAPQNGWPPPNPGCHYIGNSACGGNNGQCAPQERWLSQQCPNGQVINACGADDYCASTSKGRVYIGGAWQGGVYQINQTGDTFTIAGGAAGPAHGNFTGPRSIFVTWPQAHANYNATIDGQGAHDAQHIIYAPNNVWHR